MLYTPKEYGKVYLNGMSRQTVIRRIALDLLPSTHNAHKVGRNWLIEVPTCFKIKKTANK